MAVRVKKKALVEDRDKVQILADSAGYNAYEALGRLIHLWDKCISTKSHVLSDQQVEAFLGRGNAAAIVISGLAERVSDGVRICGAIEEIGARNRLTEQRRLAATASVVARTIDQRTVDDPSTNRERTANDPSTASLFSSSSDLGSDLGSVLSPSGASDPSLKTPRDLKQKKGKRAMPLDFAPNESDRALAVSLRLDADGELEKCRDYYAANGKHMADWRATYRNWLRNAAQYRKPASNGRTHGSAAAFDLAMEAEERERARRTS